MKYEKSKELYNWCVNTLVEAYTKNRLESGSPCGCALGNLLVRRFMDIEKCSDIRAIVSLGSWTICFSTCKKPITMLGAEILRETSDHQQIELVKGYWASAKEKGEEELKLLPMPRQVLADIEWAFETNQTGETTKEQVFNGLVAVVEVLDEYFEVGGSEQFNDLIMESIAATERREKALTMPITLETILNTIQHDRSTVTNKTSSSKSLAHQTDS